jgi:soluble lytic murein transglycosylase
MGKQPPATRKRPRASARLVVTLGALAALAAPASGVHLPHEIAQTDGPELVDGLLSLGLEREAETVLRREIDAGGGWARVALLQLLIRQGRAAEGTALVSEWDGDAEDEIPELDFTLGRLAEALKDWPAARRLFERSASQEPLLSDYAIHRAGLAAGNDDSTEAALALLETAGAAARNQDLSARAYWDAAGVALAQGVPERALEALERVPLRSVIGRPERLDLEARIYRALGRDEEEAAALRALLDQCAGSELAVGAVERLAELGEPSVDDRLVFAEIGLQHRYPSLADTHARAALRALDRNEDPVRAGRARLLLGKALLARRQYTEARRELARLPAEADPEDRAEAELDRARCLWKLGQIDAALAAYDRVLDGDFPDEQRGTAAWEAGREAKDHQRWQEAALRLGEFQRDFPEHEYADDALWHRGRALAEIEDREAAFAAFALLLERYPNSPFAEAAIYWSGVLHHRAADDSAACADLERLRVEYPDSYWTTRALATLANGPCSDARPQPRVELEPHEWLAQILPDLDAEEARQRGRHILQSESFRRAAALARLGLTAEAESELATLRTSLRRDTAALTAFAKAAWLIGLPRPAMQAVNILKIRTGQPILSGEIPAEVARLLYPLQHLGSVLHWSAEYDLDPLFVYAVMREESWFDPAAVSWAGAHGLLQIMPATGRDLARQVGLTGFRRDDLFKPDVNIRLGSYYLRRLLDELEEEPTLALSAYNAGKRNALRWRNGLSDEFDVDQYVAGITYNETYNYVQKVSRSWAIYRHLYGDLLPGFLELRASLGETE